MEAQAELIPRVLAETPDATPDATADATIEEVHATLAGHGQSFG